MGLDETRIAEEAALQTLTTRVETLTTRVRAIGAWEDRLGSAVRSAWHWRLFAGVLLVILAASVWGNFRTRPDILPYVYIWDPEGRTLWDGIPGTFTISDIMVLNRLEEWIEWARTRTPDLVVMAQQWDRAVKMTRKDSEARAMFNAYMEAENPMKLNPKPRVELSMLSKRVLHPGEYRLSWMEKRYGTTGIVIQQTTFEGDFRIELKPPKTVVEAHLYRYGFVLTAFSWGESIQPGGS